MDRQAEYLQLLQERNRLKKKISAKSKEDLVNEERERGFSTHFQGANKKIEMKVVPQGKTSLASNSPKGSSRNDSETRRGWASVPPKFILGYQVDKVDEYTNSNEDDKISRDRDEDSYDEDFDPFSDEDSLHPNIDATNPLVAPPTDFSDDLSHKLSLSPKQMKSVAVCDPSPTDSQKVGPKEVVQLQEQSLDRSCQNSGMMSPRGDLSGSDEGFPVSIRIRIHSSWSKKSRVVSLAGIRLVVLNPSVPSGCVDLDLSSFNVRVLCGFDVLPPSNEAVKSIRKLLCTTSRSSYSRGKSLAWTCPFNSASTIEINLSGELSIDVSRLFSSSAELLESTFLRIWNASDETPSECSPARDVDVFCGVKSIFSGVLGIGESRAVNPLSRLQSAPPPSLEISLSQSLDKKPMVQVVSIESYPPVVVSESENDKVDNSAPIWLEDLKTVPKDFSDSKSESIQNFLPKRRSKSNDVVGQSGSSRIVKASSGSASQRRREDDVLRASLEVIKSSDRHNRGRIGAENDTSSHLQSLTSFNVPSIVSSTLSLEPGGKEESKGAKLRSRRLQQISQVQATIASLANVLNSSDVAINTPPLYDVGSNSTSMLHCDTVLLSDSIAVLSTNLHDSALLEPPDSVIQYTSSTQAQPEEVKCHSEPVSVGIMEDCDLGCDLPKAAQFINCERGLSGTIGNDSNDIFQPLQFESSSFSTPVLPQGSEIIFEVFSTWGDKYYVGLNGIDIFDEKGTKLWKGNNVQSVSSTPFYADDPRTASNLVDGINFTRDDLHVWLTPIECKDAPSDSVVATVKINLCQPASLAMLRIFNYNKSRTHSVRGVRRCKITLDGKVVFEGEIKRSPGQLVDADSVSEVILFTTNDETLRNIAKHDETAGYYQDDASTQWKIENLKSKKVFCRPSTAEKSSTDTGDISVYASLPRDTCLDEPIKSSFAVSPESKPSASPLRKAVEAKIAQSSVSNNSSDLEFISCKRIRFTFENTWGDTEYLGLSGLEVLSGSSLSPVEVQSHQVSANPSDLSFIGCFDDPRVVTNLFNGTNSTTKERLMWLIPYTAGSEHNLYISFDMNIALTGFRVWNYNKGISDGGAWGEEVLRGVRWVSVYSDDNFVGRFLLRMGPGCDGVNFEQTVLVRDISAPTVSNCPGIAFQGDPLSYITPPLKQDYEVQLNPSGLLWKIVIHDNWNDGYYVGLDSIEFYDRCGTVIDVLTAGCVSAVPYSTKDLDLGNLMQTDDRSPLNLFKRSSGSWLAPLSRSMSAAERNQCAMKVQYGDKGGGFMFPVDNTIFVMFPYPIRVSKLIFRNYSKTVARGVRDFSIFVDGRVIYMGSLVPADKERIVPVDSRTNRPVGLKTCGQAIIFTNEPNVVRSDRDIVRYCGNTEQDVLCIDERQVIVRSKGMFDPPNVASEGISSNLQDRPDTAFVS